MLRLQERPGLPLTPVEERLFTALADQAGLVLRLGGCPGRARGQARRAAGARRGAEGVATSGSSRPRTPSGGGWSATSTTVPSSTWWPDGQPAARADPRAASPNVLRALLGLQADAAMVAIETLSSLSRGIYPRLLAEQGLVAALRSAVAASAIPVTIDADGDGGDCPRPVEAALYFCCMEAVQNAAKHSGASTVTVRLSDDAGTWRLVVTDDGAGFDQTGAQSTGAGLANMRDRLDAVGGTVTVRPWQARARRSPPLVDRSGGLTCARGSPGRWSAVAVVATVLDTVFTAAHRSLLSEATWAEHGWPLAPLASLGCALMGALIVSRHPRHPLGWLLCVASLLSVTLAAEAYSIWVLDGDGPGPRPGATWRSGRGRCSAGRPSPHWCWCSSSPRTATCRRPGGAGQSGSPWPASPCTPWGR